MIYAYKCRACLATYDSTTRTDRLCGCSCGGEFTRDYSGVAFDHVMQEHYNPSANQYISSNRQFDQVMKRAAEKVSNETGMEHDFQRVDPTDKKALGVTEQGMDATNRTRRAKGLPTFK